MTEYTFPTKGDKVFTLTEEMVARLHKTYPHKPVLEVLHTMRQKMYAEKSKYRYTSARMYKTICSWIERNPDVQKQTTASHELMKPAKFLNDDEWEASDKARRALHD